MIRNIAGSFFVFFLGGDLWEMSKVNHCCNQEKDASNHDVGDPDHTRFKVPVVRKLLRTHRSQFGGCVLNSREKEYRAQVRSNHRAHSIKRSSEFHHARPTLAPAYNAP